MEEGLLAKVEARLQSLPRGLVDHCHRVSRLCTELARRFGVAEDKAELAALAHDLARAHPPEQLLELAQRYGMAPNEAERQVPLLLHGPLAAAMLRDMGVQDAELLQAVAHHTTGQPSMSPLDKVLFLADKLEDRKQRGSPELGRLRKLAEQDPDAAVRELLRYQVERLRQAGAPLHPATVAALEALDKPSKAHKGQDEASKGGGT